MHNFKTFWCIILNPHHTQKAWCEVFSDAPWTLAILKAPKLILICNLTGCCNDGTAMHLDALPLLSTFLIFQPRISCFHTVLRVVNYGASSEAEIECYWTRIASSTKEKNIQVWQPIDLWGVTCQSNGALILWRLWTMPWWCYILWRYLFFPFKGTLKIFSWKSS